MGKAIIVEDVWKKFRRGERLDTLRDFIPALFGGKFKALSQELAKDEFWALKGISFEVEKGQSIGIIGHNGAGKSTLLKILTRIMYPEKGKVEVNGRVSALIEVTAGFHPELTGRENIYLNAAILGMKKKEVDKKIDSIIDFSELRDFIDTPVKRYSSGMYSRLGFSVAAHMDPEILIVDEVLSVGDIAFQAKCRRRMQEMVKSGITVIYVSHNMPSVVELCERVIMLERGQIKEQGEPAEVIRHYYESYGSYRVADKFKGKIEMPRAELLNHENKPINFFNAGEKAKVKFTFVAKEDFEGVTHKIIVKRADGMAVYTTDSFRVEGKRYNLKKDTPQDIEVVLDMNLPQGNYFIDVEIEKQFQGCVFMAQDAIGFSITARPSSGPAYLNARWVE